MLSKVLHFEHHRLDFLFEHLPGILEGLEFPLARGDGDLAIT